MTLVGPLILAGISFAGHYNLVILKVWCSPLEASKNVLQLVIVVFNLVGSVFNSDIFLDKTNILCSEVELPSDSIS